MSSEQGQSPGRQAGGKLTPGDAEGQVSPQNLLTQTHIEDIVDNENEVNALNHTLYTNARVGGRITQILVDTGATVSLLHERIWNQLSGKDSDVCPMNTAVKSVNGQQLKIRGRVELEFGFGGYKTKHVFLLTADIGTECLLGMDFLVAHGCVIKCQAIPLSLPGYSPIKLGPHTTTSPRVYRVAIQETVTVPCNHEVLVRGRLQPRKGHAMAGFGVGVIETFTKPKQFQREGLVVGRVLATPDAMNTLPIRMLNCGQEPVVLLDYFMIKLRRFLKNAMRRSAT